MKMHRCKKLHYNFFRQSATPVDIFAYVVSGHHWFREWFDVRSVASHYLSQFRNIANGTRGKSSELINLTSMTRQNGRHFLDVIFQRISFNENVSTNTWQNFGSYGPVDCNPELVQMIAWRRQGDGPLSEPMKARYVLKIPKFKHDTFGKSAFAVCEPLTGNCLPKEIRLCDEFEAFKQTIRLIFSLNFKMSLPLQFDLKNHCKAS